MKVKFVTADGCERYEERAFEGTYAPAILQVAILRPIRWMLAAPTEPMADYVRTYDLSGHDIVTGAGGRKEEVFVYCERL